MKTILTIFFALSGFIELAIASDCEIEYYKRTSEMQLSYEEFDQTSGRGFRGLSARGCYAEAAMLIQEYMRVMDSRVRVLSWHAAQNFAMAGDESKAVEFAKRAINTDEDLDTNPFRWNDYVLGTIAFLEGNRAVLRTRRDNIANAETSMPGNLINIKFLDNMLKNFDKSYLTIMQTTQ